MIALAVAITASASAAWTPTWVPGSGNWAGCAKTTTVFGVTICLTPAAAAGGLAAKANHVANVVAQLLDNDADGAVDCTTTTNKMVSENFYLFVPASNADSEAAESSGMVQPAGVGQMSHLGEAVPNSCDTPTNRGASATDRATWAAAKDTTAGCDAGRDATTEEVLHLITEAAAQLWPAKWGRSFASTAGALIRATNGNCGWGFSSDYKDPSTNACVGQYAYDDDTCDEACIVVEGIYWAIVSCARLPSVPAPEPAPPRRLLIYRHHRPPPHAATRCRHRPPRAGTSAGCTRARAPRASRRSG